MGRRGPNLLRLLSLLFLISAVVLFFYELVAYSRERAELPEGLVIAGVPAGGVGQAEALERLLKTYSTPVVLYYGDQAIQLSPASVGYELDSEAMLAAAELTRTETDFWSGFWDYLWNRPGEVVRVPLRSEYSQTQLREALVDISARYDQPAMPGQPIPGSPNFNAGQPGRVLDIDRAQDLVGEVLNSPTDREVNLPVVASEPPRPSLATLKTLTEQLLEVQGFDGLAVMYLRDLRSGEELHFGIFQGEEISVDPDISFTAASIIKIPILVTYYRYFDEPLNPEQDRWVNQMITESGNDPADWLMEEIDRLQGPLVVTETMQDLGFDSTFLAGYFRLGSELLSLYRTPGNQRPDIDTRPDVYNQTTASEMGVLLSDIYLCARGGGNLLAAFPEQVYSEECGKMLEMLAGNQIALLLEAGVPEGTQVAHKHGWTSSPLDTIGDAGIVYTPGGDFVLSLFLWDETEMIWEPTSRLFADIVRAVYNYYNPPAESPGA